MTIDDIRNAKGVALLELKEAEDAVEDAKSLLLPLMTTFGIVYAALGSALEGHEIQKAASLLASRPNAAALLEALSVHDRAAKALNNAEQKVRAFGLEASPRVILV